MTVRQAVGVLVEEDLVNRVHGSGTYVKRIEVGTTTFNLSDLDKVLTDTGPLDIKVLKSDIVRVQGAEKKMLQLQAGDPAILVERVINHKGIPFCFQTAYLPFDPKSPVVENMLDTTGLSVLFFSNQCHGYKKGYLTLLPTRLTRREGKLLDLAEDRLAFKLEYMYYDFKNNPGAYGWFIIPPEQMPLVSRVGVWDD